MQSLRPARSMGTIYLEAAHAASSLAVRAEKAFERTKNPKANDTAQMAKRFAAKCTRAAEKTILLKDDGALKDYCARFDKVFAQFVAFSEVAEHELTQIEKVL